MKNKRKQLKIYCIYININRDKIANSLKMLLNTGDPEYNKFKKRFDDYEKIDTENMRMTDMEKLADEINTFEHQIYVL